MAKQKTDVKERLQVDKFEPVSLSLRDSIKEVHNEAMFSTYNVSIQTRFCVIDELHFVSRYYQDLVIGVRQDMRKTK